MKNNKLSHIHLDLIDLYMNKNKSYTEIANSLNINKSSVYRYLKQLNLINKRKKEYKSLVGEKFNNLTVISYEKTNRYKNGGIYRLWKCQCVCGTIVNVRECNLKNGQQSCKLCSSQKVANLLKQCVIDYNVWFRIVQSCKNKNIPFDVTPEYLLQIFQKQNGKCALSGVSIFFGKTRKDETTASPDRIIPEKGYTFGNIRWVHKYVNSMRNNKPTNEFIEWCKTITDYSRSNSAINSDY